MKKERQKERKKKRKQKTKKEKEKLCDFQDGERDIYGETLDKWLQRGSKKIEKKRKVRRHGAINNNHKYESKQLK